MDGERTQLDGKDGAAGVVQQYGHDQSFSAARLGLLRPGFGHLAWKELQNGKSNIGFS